MPNRSASFADARTEPYAHVLELKRGGMGRVEIVVRERGAFRRLYARKRMHAHFLEDEGFRAMFLDEARVAGLLRHPNVVSVLDYGEDDDGPYLVMDYVDGLSLYEMLRALDRARAIPIGVCVAIVQQIAEGLHAAHELRGEDGAPLAVVHRDVSPQNVLVGFDGLARVTDFGIARAYGQGTKTATGVLKGKLGYMSPEQLRFERPDRRADLFALGVVLAELVTRRRLYARDEDADTARAILHDPPPDLGEEREDVPDALVQLAFELLAKERDERPATARIVADRLAAILDELRAQGETVDVAAFVRTAFAEQRAASQETLRVALEAMRDRAARAVIGATSESDESPTEPGPSGAPIGTSIEVELPSDPPPPARSWRRVALAAVVLAVALAALALVGGSMGPSASPVAARASTSAPVAPAAPVVAPPPVAEPLAIDPAPEAPAETTTVEEEPEVRTSRARDRRRARATREGEAPAAPTTPEGPLRIWGWE